MEINKDTQDSKVPYDDLSIEEQEAFLAQHQDSLWSEPDAEAQAFYAKLAGPGLDENDNVVFPGGNA